MHDYKYLVKFYSHLQKHGTGAVAQHLTALATFAEDPSSILSIHMQRLQSPVTPRPGDLKPTSRLCEHTHSSACSTCEYAHAHMPIHKHIHRFFKQK